MQQKWDASLVNWAQTGLLVLVSVSLTFLGMKEYFTIMPIRNPPLFEDIASWIAWRTEEPHTILYLDSTEKTPHRVEYLVNTHMVPHEFDSVPAYEFNWQDLPDKTIVFIESLDDDIPPSTFKNSAIYTDRDGKNIGYAWANTSVDLQPSPPYPITREEFPVTIIPVFSALTIIAILLILLRIRVTTEKTTNKPGLRIYTEITLRKAFKKEANKET